MKDLLMLNIKQDCQFQKRIVASVLKNPYFYVCHIVKVSKKILVGHILKDPCCHA